MNTLYLGDLKNEEDLKELLGEMLGRGYIWEDSLDYSSNELKKNEMIDNEVLNKYEFIVAWLNDECYNSSCFMLFREKGTDNYFSVYGSHCSCYGYEGQFEPTPTLISTWNCDKFEGEIYNLEECVKAAKHVEEYINSLKI